MTVRQAFTKFDIVAGRDYLFQNRQGLNSLRHTKSAIPAPFADGEQPREEAVLKEVPIPLPISQAAAAEKASLLLLEADIGRLERQLRHKRAELWRLRRRPEPEHVA
eukprot:COSAG01_NODE_4427_length_5035_cov_2.138574_9_plen_107_part_00